METKLNLVVFFDSVGRTVIGEKSNEDTNDQILGIKNPAVVHIAANQASGQLTLQILPLFFKEFLADKTAPTIWHYQKNQITEAKDLALDFKLQNQYQQLFSNAPVPQSSGQASPDVIKLFDD